MGEIKKPGDHIGRGRDDKPRSSEKWVRSLNLKCRILDPDGWDRSTPEKFEASWHERITREEFFRRLDLSTLAHNWRKQDQYCHCIHLRPPLRRELEGVLDAHEVVA